MSNEQRIAATEDLLQRCYEESTLMEGDELLEMEAHLDELEEELRVLRQN